MLLFTVIDFYVMHICREKFHISGHRLLVTNLESYFQAESMVAEWREFLWDVPEERVSLWGHCQTLFIRYSFPPLQVQS